MSEELMNEQVEEVEATEETTPETEGADTEATPDPYADFLSEFKIKYDGEDVGYENIDDLIADAQKGKNYQRMVDKVDSFKNNPAYQYIDQYMKDSGFTDPAKFVKELRVNEKVAELIKDGMDEEKAKKYAEQMVTENPVDVKGKEIGDFLQWHSDKVKQGVFGEELEAENIPQEVIDAYEKGQSLKEAYQDHMLKNIKFKTEQETLQKLDNNKRKSAGKIEEGTKNSTKDMTVTQIDKLMSSMSSSERSSWIKNNYSVAEKAGYFG